MHMFSSSRRITADQAVRQRPVRKGKVTMDTQKLLGELAGQLLSGGIEVVDLSAVLGPETPLIKLPPDFAVDTPAIEIHTISQYDKNGPFWAWNWLKLGEHSGTHF